MVALPEFLLHILLYVENYHFDAGLKAWIFDSFSPSCGASVTAGSLGLILLIAAVAVKFYFLRKSEEPSRNVVLTMAIIATVWAFIAFIMACIFSAGLSQTCHQFEQSGKSCSAVFGQGFFANDTKTIYSKNINTINAALGASWIVFLGWTGFAITEWINYRNSSLKWW
ncbi:hypothetical protein HDU91_004854 [Kappamyces sp. JEL0680]|nr:hypothetical protein HDU91_004854 [Kappamyces sp. JEL0680]